MKHCLLPYTIRHKHICKCSVRKGVKKPNSCGIVHNYLTLFVGFYFIIIWYVYQLTTNGLKCMIWGPVNSVLTFLQFSQKCEFIDPSGHFVFYEIFCSSNFLVRTSPRSCSGGSPGGRIKISFKKLVAIYHMRTNRKN